MADTRPIIVQKYGGSSVADTGRIRQVAQIIAERYQSGAKLCVVVSAMGKTTDQLLAQAHEVSRKPERRELDMLLTCGERTSMALLAMALNDLNVPSISLTGSQSGIITDDVHSGAHIIEVKPFRVLEALEQNKVVIIAGFQGVSQKREITTLGRGGSDTTAVAMAAALNADACEIYSDVQGVLSADPKVVPDALLLNEIGIEDMMALSEAGAKVLNAQAVEFAKRFGITIHARKTGDAHPGTIVVPTTQNPTLHVTAIAHQKDIYALSLPNLSALQQILPELSKQGIVPHLITGNSNIQCFIYPEDAHGLVEIVKLFSHQQISLSTMGSVSVIGETANTPLVLKIALESLKTAGILFTQIATKARCAEFYMASDDVKYATQVLHQALIVRS